MHSLNPNDIRFFSGQSHPELAAGIASYLSIPLEETRFDKFSNDNLFIQLGASVRGRNVFIVQSLNCVLLSYSSSLIGSSSRYRASLSSRKSIAC